MNSDFDPNANSTVTQGLTFLGQFHGSVFVKPSYIGGASSTRSVMVRYKVLLLVLYSLCRFIWWSLNFSTLWVRLFFRVGQHEDLISKGPNRHTEHASEIFSHNPIQRFVKTYKSNFKLYYRSADSIYTYKSLTQCMKHCNLSHNSAIVLDRIG